MIKPIKSLFRTLITGIALFLIYMLLGLRWLAQIISIICGLCFMAIIAAAVVIASFGGIVHATIRRKTD